MSAASNPPLMRLERDLLVAVVRHRLSLYFAVWAPWVLLLLMQARLSLLPLSLGQVVLYALASVVLFAIIICLDVWFWQRRIARNILSWLNHASPELEDSSQLLQKADTPIASLQRQRLVQRLASVCGPALMQYIAQRFASVSGRGRVALVFNAMLALSMFLAAPYLKETHMIVRPASTTSAVQDGQRFQLGELHLRIQAPSYTGIAQFESSAKDLVVAEQSQVNWCVTLDHSLNEMDAQAYFLARPIELSNGEKLTLRARDIAANKEPSKALYCAQWVASESVFWSWPETMKTKSSEVQQSNVKAQRWTIKVTPDNAPTVQIEQPKEMLQVLSLTTKEVTLQVTVRDDYRVSNAQLHMTLARGSGENIRFSDKEVPIPQSSDPKWRSWKRSWSLQELGMEAGDELYFFVRATDNAQPAAHQTTSATYTLRMPLPEVKEEATSVIPILAKPESLRSQRQIIIDTENLLADMKANPKLNPLIVRNRSEIIANDQAALRRRYGKFLGEESSLFGDEEHGEHDGHEGEHGGQQDAGKGMDMAAAFGHAHDQAENATLFDEATKKILRRVLVAMWDAEKSLRAISPANALGPENKALEGIKQLQQADRIYLHKAAFTPPVIKEEKRLSGDAKDARDWKSQQVSNQATLPSDVAALMQALAEDAALPADWSKTARAWIAQGLPQDEQRLAAQAAVQDVSDGCAPCKLGLRAWLRQAMPAPSLLLQAPRAPSSANSSAVEKAWQASGLASSGRPESSTAATNSKSSSTMKAKQPAQSGVRP